MENRRIKIGIVGAGRMGITHYAIINTHPDVEVSAVVDTTPFVSSMIEKYMNVRTYKSHSKMFAEEPLDAVLVCTPPALNCEILKEAHKRNAHVFLEKPGTLSAEHLYELADAFEARQLVNQVGYVNRFNDVFVRVKRLLEQGVVGEVVRFRSEMYSRTIIHPELSSGWRSARSKGGGAVYEMASHSIDLMNFFFGAPQAVAGSSLTQIFSRSVEDAVSSTFLYRDGRVGTLYVNWSDASYRKPTNKIEIFGKLGKVLADQHGFKIHLSADNTALGLRQGWNSMSITDVFTSVPFYVRGVEFTAQLYDFIECIKAPGGRPSRCTFRDGAAVLKVIDDIFQDHARNAQAIG